MKNTNRVRHNGGKPRYSIQVENPSQFVLRDGEDVNPACLAFFDRLNQKLYKKVSLSDKDFSRMVDRSIRMRTTPDEFVAQAILEKLNPQHIPTCELESATWQANSMLDVLYEKLQEVATGVNDFRGDRVDKYLAGMAQLLMATQERLTKAYEAVHNAAQTQPEAASCPGRV